MPPLTPDSVYAPGRNPPKSEIIQLLWQIIGGAAGIGDFQGSWDDEQFYVARDFVERGGSLWQAKRDNVNVTPVEGPDWTLLLPGASVADGTVGANKLTGAGSIRGFLDVSQGRPLPMPTGFNWPADAGVMFGLAPVSVVRERSGKYACTSHPWLMPPDGTVYYVNADSGSDGNNGLTPATAFLSIDKALSMSGARKVWVAPGKYIAGKGWTDTPTTNNCSIEVSGGGKALILCGVTPGWSSGGSAGVYKATVTQNVVAVVNPRQTDQYGLPLSIPEFPSKAALIAASTAGWVVDSGEVFIRLVDAAGAPIVPSSGYVAVLYGTDGARIDDNDNAGVGVYHVKGLQFWGGVSAFKANSRIAGAMSAVFEDCDFAFSEVLGLDGDDLRGGVVLVRCRAFGNGSDGFNYHSTIYSSYALEVDCVSLGNGLGEYASVGTNNGSSIHDEGSIVRVGGIYGGGTGPSLVDVGKSHSWNIGCTVLERVGSAGVDASVEAWDGSSQGGSKMWLDDCRVAKADGTVALYAHEGGRIYYRRLDSDGSKYEDVVGRIVAY